MNNILITSAGRRVSLVKAFQNELTSIFPGAKVFVADLRTDLSAAAQIVDKAFDICRITDPDYIPMLLDICIQNEVKLVIPTLDTELAVMAKSKSLFDDKGITLMVSDEALIQVSDNKVNTEKFFDKLDIPVGRIYTKDNYKLPVYIKPFNGSRSIDNFIIKKESDFSEKHFSEDRFLFFEYLDHDIYEEYTCDLYYDKKGDLKCAVPRKRIEVRGGEVSKGITKKDAVYDYIISKLTKLEGARGCITFQFFKNKENDDIRGIEINARFGGGYPLTYLAGGNFPKWIIEEYLCDKSVENFQNWEEDLLMLRYDAEVLVHGHKA
ncbi:ATP-grasp domain-containing protein [Hyunsoonleella sp. SJ7]|uniref:ATP-grasp domain-containing protein n=1 Tax=Hyunsoonleella aquatilis TaxID=2762758 RepID=A0A923HEN4_9FLAO|nr:ATP-grasp domain-containing protein [Hyunsoonleella aquatilis]MBC3759776.1 ATP-grasp domain-containing protein [Hyunsoonleella aquatilis]